MIPNELSGVLGAARERGFLGGQAIERQIDHSEAFGDIIRAVLAPADVLGAVPLALLDLGSGGGVPGLVLAAQRPERFGRFTLLEGSERRARFIAEAVKLLELSATVEVIGLRAELVGRWPSQRGAYDVVVSRSFGPPAVTAECAAPFLRPGGVLIVSEPPPAAPAEKLPTGAAAVSPGPLETRRWPDDGLSLVSLGPAEYYPARGYGFAVMRLLAPCPDRYPRRIGVPVKRPLFSRQAERPKVPRDTVR